MSRRACLLVPALLAGVFAGCAAEQGPMPDRPATGWGAGSGPGPMQGPGSGPMMGPGSGPIMGPGGPGAGAGMGMAGEASRMCATYRDLTAGKPAAEGRAAVDSQMQAMHGGTLTPEQLRVRREEMERRCSASTDRR